MSFGAKSEFILAINIPFNYLDGIDYTILIVIQQQFFFLGIFPRV